MIIKHYLQFSDFTKDEYQYVIERSRIIKNKFKNCTLYHPLVNKNLVMIFEKHSTRTRLSFEIGMYQLGGNAIYLNTQDSQLNRGELIEDTARVISRMCDIVVIRTFEQNIINRFSRYSKVPVINGLTNEYHPCQVLADIFTYIEHRGSIKNKIVAWVGDANNMLYSWLQAAKIFEFHLNISTPKKYTINHKLVSDIKRNFTIFINPIEACKNAHLVTTDVWTSMGHEKENAIRLKEFNGWIVDSVKMSHADSYALFMHCLPAHRGEEVSTDVIDGTQSVVWDEAENRLHVQKALLEYLILGKII